MKISNKSGTYKTEYYQKNKKRISEEQCRHQKKMKLLFKEYLSKGIISDEMKAKVKNDRQKEIFDKLLKRCMSGEYLATGRYYKAIGEIKR